MSIKTVAEGSNYLAINIGKLSDLTQHELKGTDSKRQSFPWWCSKNDILFYKNIRK